MPLWLVKISYGFAITILPLDKKTFYRGKEVAANKNKAWKVKRLSLNEQLNRVTRKAEFVSSVPEREQARKKVSGLNQQENVLSRSETFRSL